MDKWDIYIFILAKLQTGMAFCADVYFRTVYLVVPTFFLTNCIIGMPYWWRCSVYKHAAGKFLAMRVASTDTQRAARDVGCVIGMVAYATYCRFWKFFRPSIIFITSLPFMLFPTAATYSNPTLRSTRALQRI